MTNTVIMSSITLNSSLDTWKREDYLCRKHGFTYEFKNLNGNKLYCKKCITECNLQTSELQLFAETHPVVEAAIVEKITEINDHLQKDLKAIDYFKDQCCKKMNYVREYKEKIRKLENNLLNLISEANVLGSKRWHDLSLVQKLYFSKHVKSEADISRILPPGVTLGSLKSPICLPALPAPEANLCNIACNFIMNEVIDEVPVPSNCALISATEKPTKNADAKTVLGANELKDGGVWIMNSKNCQAILKALADRQPRVLVVRSRHDKKEFFQKATVAAVAKAARDCDVHLELYSSFFASEKHETDQEFLKCFLDNSSIRLAAFYGHLDAAGIVGLPTSVDCLGLSITCASEANAISSLKHGKNLFLLQVSVSTNVVPCDLGQLPNVDSLTLSFPGLTDVNVDNVRSSIEVLVPNLDFDTLIFPLNRLSASGAGRLVQKLRGVCCDEVAIELCGSWQPEKEEKERIEDQVITAVGCSLVDWNMDWLYIRLVAENYVNRVHH